MIPSRFFFFLFFLMVFNGCVSFEYNVATHHQDIIFYSTDKEINLGRNLAKEIAKEFKISQNPTYIERINRIGQKIVKVCDRKELIYHFYVIEKDEKNAFSIPGGYVYIFEGLLKKLKDDDELAFVLAHEIGHIVARHSIKKLQAILGYNLLILATTTQESSPQFYQGLSFAMSQIMAAYSREDEFTADELAVKYLKKANFSPLAGIRVLEKLYDIHRKEPPRQFSYVRTHPFIPQRIKHIKEVLGIPLTICDYLNQ